MSKRSDALIIYVFLLQQKRARELGLKLTSVRPEQLVLKKDKEVLHTFNSTSAIGPFLDGYGDGCGKKSKR